MRTAIVGACMPSPGEVTDDPTPYPAIKPRPRTRGLSDFRTRRADRYRNAAATAHARLQSIECPADRLDEPQRLAQIRHAILNGLSAWEIAALVPGPISESELALYRSLAPSATDADQAQTA